MKRHLLLLVLLLTGLLNSFSIFPSSDRGKVIRIKNLDPDNEVGRQYLVLIAINKYEYWRGLTQPVKDGIEIRDILQSHYYFDKMFELYDDQATRVAIVMLFEQLQKELNPEDSVLIFYAGHGYLTKSSGVGYWIPVNGGKDERECQNWISHGEIIGFISNMKAKHIFLIADSCFAGNFLEVWRGDNDGPKVINQEYFRRAYQLNSRQVLTSGAEETVPDNSIFARELKKALRENDRPYLDPIKLYDDIRLAEMKTLP
ncbi:MAG TPA: caspase family protein, partial [Candidatus Kapabacteria bacterium]|nr:caspase family protein [Candidatus Kapabacteria bacterium]